MSKYRLSFIFTLLVVLLNSSLELATAGFVEGSKCSVRNSTKTVNGVKYYCNYRNGGSLIWQIDYSSNTNNSSTSNSTSECTVLKSYVRTQQNKLSIAVTELNKKVSIAQSTYQQSDIKNYLNAYAYYAKKVWEMLNEASLHESCYSTSKAVTIETEMISWEQLYYRSIKSSTLSVDPGLLRATKAPKFYEYLFDN